MYMVITREINDFWKLYDNCWSSAKQVLEKVEEKGLEEDLMALLEELFGGEFEGKYSETNLNDFIRFDLESYEPFGGLWD